jgi:hypothetical protein
VDLRVPAVAELVLTESASTGEAFEEVDFRVVALMEDALAVEVADALGFAFSETVVLEAAFTSLLVPVAAFARGLGVRASGVDLATLLEGALGVFLLDSLMGFPSSSQFPQVQT